MIIVITNFLQLTDKKQTKKIRFTKQKIYQNSSYLQLFSRFYNYFLFSSDFLFIESRNEWTKDRY